MARETREMLVPTDDFVHTYDGIEYTYTVRNSRVWSDDPRIQGILHLFKPLDPSERFEQATAGPGERRGA